MAEKKKAVKTEKASWLSANRGNLIFGVAWFLLFFFMIVFTGVFESVEHRWLDIEYKKLRGVVETNSKIVLVKFDDETIASIGSYPWPRRVYGQLIDKLVKMGAHTIAFDFMFSEASPSKEDDRIFLDAVKRSKRCILACWLQETPGSFYKNFDIHWPFGKLRAAAAGIGYVNVPQDNDGEVRLVPAYRTKGDTLIPILSLAALAHWQEKPIETYYPKFQDTEGVAVINLRGEEHTQQVFRISDNKEVDPEDPDVQAHPNRYVIHKKDSIAFPTISAADVLKGKFVDLKVPEKIKGGIVFVGSTALGAFDHYPSPFSEKMPGVLVHMTMVDNFLNNDYFQPSVPLVQVIFVAIMIVLASVYVNRFAPLTGALSTLGTLGLWTLLSYEMFIRNRLLDWSAPAIAHGSTFVILLVQRTLAEAREKKWIKNTFGQYLSPKVVEILVNDPTKLTLGGEKRDLTIFFLDIAHFTTISEKMDPEALTKFLNEYLTALTDVIMGNDGVVDKYIGDCIMAFWNAPLDQPRHRLLACLSAVKCIETMNTLNDTILPPGIPERPACRIGLNSGFAVVGNMGSNMRFSYTVIGDEVNLASRLEGANKFFGSRIMASEATFKGQAEEVVAGRPLGRVKVVGKDIPILVYELMGEKGKLNEKKQKMLEAYLEGLDHFLARRFEKAQAHFERAIELVPDDGPSKLYLKTAQDFAIVPPQGDWDGVWALTAK